MRWLMCCAHSPVDPAQLWDRRGCRLSSSWLSPHFSGQTRHIWAPPRRCESLLCSTGLRWKTRPGGPVLQPNPLVNEKQDKKRHWILSINTQIKWLDHAWGKWLSRFCFFLKWTHVEATYIKLYTYKNFIRCKKKKKMYAGYCYKICPNIYWRYPVQIWYLTPERQDPAVVHEGLTHPSDL